jgi:hypothetical protein
MFPVAALAVSVTAAGRVLLDARLRRRGATYSRRRGDRPLALTVITRTPAATAVKFALTDFAVFVTVQVGALPVQAPPSRRSDAPAAGVAVSVTGEFVGRSALHPEARRCCR